MKNAPLPRERYSLQTKKSTFFYLTCIKIEFFIIVRPKFIRNAAILKTPLMDIVGILTTLEIKWSSSARTYSNQGTSINWKTSSDLLSWCMRLLAALSLSFSLPSALTSLISSLCDHAFAKKLGLEHSTYSIPKLPKCCFQCHAIFSFLPPKVMCANHPGFHKDLQLNMTRVVSVILSVAAAFLYSRNF